MVNLKMVDSQGFGIHDMYVNQRDRFLPLPDYDNSTVTHVVLEMPGQVINQEYSEVLMDNVALDLHTVILLDRAQKGKLLSKDEVKKLRVKKLIEGRYPNIMISKKIAGLTHKEVEYTNLSGFDDQWYRDLILKALKEHGRLRRADFDQLLIPKLPGILSYEQKVNKVENLLRKLRSDGKIYFGERKYWFLNENDVCGS